MFLWSLLASLRAPGDSLGMEVAFPDFSRTQATPQLLPIVSKDWGAEGNLPLQILTLGMLLGWEMCNGTSVWLQQTQSCGVSQRPTWSISGNCSMKT